MKSKLVVFAGFIACLTGMRMVVAAQKAPTPFSTYGEIQGVQKYSSNPFWNKDSPYNQRMPTPIYATGADLNTGDCNRVVGNLIASYCASNDCKKISDVRPTVMVQLSQLPGHNFATSCGGYIDSEFENYKKTYGNVSTNNIVKPATKQQTTQTVQLNNIFAKQPSKYEQGVAERTAELKRLQSANASTPGLTAQEFPKTIDDISFSDRMALASAGYEPYAELKAYKIPDFEEEDEAFFNRLKAVNPTKYCERRPNNAFCNPATSQTGGNNSNNGSNNSNNGTDPNNTTPEQPPCDNPGASPDCPIVLNLN